MDTATPTPTASASVVETPVTLSVFPNPLLDRGDVTVEFSVEKVTTRVEIRLFTAAYRPVYEAASMGMFTPGRRWRERLDLGATHLANGVYYLQVKPAGGAAGWVKWVVLR
jgi:hypothetical protein